MNVAMSMNLPGVGRMGGQNESIPQQQQQQQQNDNTTTNKLIGPHLEQSMENGRLLGLRSLSVIHALTAAHATIPDGKGGTTLVVRQQPVPEFLYQVTRMLMECNPQIIEWSSMGRILVHDPDRLQEEVLGNYFRHHRFSSFQRQLNYFGFRKFSGKGRMSPCTYMNDDVTSDVRSLLTIKVRKEL
jgi:hypothetical protein